MSLPLKIEAQLEGSLRQLLGSFWTSVFKETDKVWVLLDSVTRTRFIGDFLAVVANFAGDMDKAKRVRHVEVSFRPSDVIETGDQLYGDPEHEEFFGYNTDANTVYGRHWVKYWALPVKDIIPLGVQTKDRQWIIGSDFVVHRNRYIYFREDPRKVFPEGQYLVTRGYRLQQRSYLSFFTGVQVEKNHDLIIDYLRQSQTPKSFRLAICAAAGLGIIRKGGTLQYKTEFPSGDVVYTFPDEMIRVSYSHEHLVEGQTYEPLTVIGDTIKIFQAETKPSAWWRQIDWRGGLVLDPILAGTSNLPLPDAEVVAYTAGQDEGSIDGSKVHARVQLSEDFTRDQAYWEKVQKRETESGFYLNNVLGLSENENDEFETLLQQNEEANQLNQFLGLEFEQPALEVLPNVKWVNALDVFFQAVLGLTAFVITIDQRKLKRQREAFNFISRELPAGGTPVIIGFLSGLQDAADLLDRDLLVDETVVIVDLTPVEVMDSVDLGLLVQETVLIRQETVTF